MDDKTVSFNETQLKRVGMAEAFTPMLRAQMEQGVPIIQHQFKKQYDGDAVEATLHLKKSATSDYYFLNKFDLKLQKEGQTESLNHTFYINVIKQKNGEEREKQKNRLENKYTLKEAYNLLAGRPVFKNLVNQDGNEYQTWVRLNLKKQLPNGNYEMKLFTRNYGFDLEKTLSAYPIKEIENEKFKKSLIDSLHRGNMQNRFSKARGSI